MSPTPAALPLAQSALGGYDCGVSGKRILAVAAGLALLVGVPPSQSAGAMDTAQALDRIYSEHDLQTAMPIKELPPPGKSRRFAGAPWLLAALLATAACVVLAAWLAQVDWERLRERRRTRTATVAARDGNPVARREWFAAADALARQGHHGRAIHALLVGVLNALSNATPWPAAATPREIASKHVTAADLRMLVAAAELAHFAGRPASEADYLACRAGALRLHRSPDAAASQPSARAA